MNETEKKEVRKTLTELGTAIVKLDTVLDGTTSFLNTKDRLTEVALLLAAVYERLQKTCSEP